VLSFASDAIYASFIEDCVMQPLAKKASEDALDLLNRAIQSKRSLSEFEKIKIESHLNSAKKAEPMEYHTVSACYYAHIADFDSLLICADYVFSGRYNVSQAMNVLFALYNTSQFEKIVEILDTTGFELLDDPSFIDMYIFTYSICNKFDKIEILIKKISEEIKSHKDVVCALYFSANMHHIFNKDDSSELSGYLIEALSIYSWSMASMYRDDIGEASLQYLFFEDESEHFFNIKFGFDSDSIEDVFDAEDDFLRKISKLNYKPSVRSKISFSFYSTSDVKDD